MKVTNRQAEVLANLHRLEMRHGGSKPLFYLDGVNCSTQVASLGARGLVRRDADGRPVRIADPDGFIPGGHQHAKAQQVASVSGDVGPATPVRGGVAPFGASPELQALADRAERAIAANRELRQEIRHWRAETREKFERMLDIGKALRRSASTVPLGEQGGAWSAPDVAADLTQP